MNTTYLHMPHFHYHWSRRQLKSQHETKIRIPFWHSKNLKLPSKRQQHEDSAKFYTYHSIWGTPTTNDVASAFISHESLTDWVTYHTSATRSLAYSACIYTKQKLMMVHSLRIQITGGRKHLHSQFQVATCLVHGITVLPQYHHPGTHTHAAHRTGPSWQTLRECDLKSWIQFSPVKMNPEFLLRLYLINKWRNHAFKLYNPNTQHNLQTTALCARTH